MFEILKHLLYVYSNKHAGKDDYPLTIWLYPDAIFSWLNLAHYLYTLFILINTPKMLQ